ncbi:membrane protein [Streptomyces phage Miek]|nr:hypothetical protein SEA_SENDITCS_61 [Streptomyces phage SendItCS]WIC89399.1 membrane protein [Streptomyces phage Miek]
MSETARMILGGIIGCIVGTSIGITFMWWFFNKIDGRNK